MGRTKGAKDSKPRKRKLQTRADAPGAEALERTHPGIGHNSDPHPSRLTPDEEQSLFMHHREKWLALANRQKLLDEQWIAVKANLKADGFKVIHMRIADDLGTPKGEQRVVTDVTERLRVARWIGHAMGRQLDIFEHGRPERSAVADRAYDQGATASASNMPRKPPYDPGAEGYDAWMAGYNDHQEELAARVGKGADRTQELRETIAEGNRIIRENAAS